jgi:hypothetical protein
MPQTVIVASGTTEAVSAQQVVAAGVSATLVIYAATGAVQPDQTAEITYDTPAGDVCIGYLSSSQPAVQISGPCTFLVKKQPSAAACAVLIDT